MLLAYVDESATDDWYVMAGLIVDGEAAATLSDELDRIVRSAAAAYRLDPAVELHGFEIFQAKRAWKGVPVRARVGVFADVAGTTLW